MSTESFDDTDNRIPTALAVDKQISSKINVTLPPREKKGNRADGYIVCANGAGSIHSVYYVMTENETARASWGYNATTGCVELGWR